MKAPVTKILDFGALVNLLPGKDGLSAHQPDRA
jgi:polyribonucleotide nucleotidyltransferase